MAEETTIQTQETQQGAEQQERTFTQEEVNQLVKNRLATERKKYADYDALKQKAGLYDQQQEAGKSDLQKATERADDLQRQLDAMTKATATANARSKVAAETGVPAELLTGEDEASCKAQAEAILKFAKPTTYPGTKKNTGTHRTDSTHDDAMREFARQLFGKGDKT